jgi:hypothetical protein
MAPADMATLIQRLHITAGHIICGLIEQRGLPLTAEENDSPHSRA